MRCLLLVVAVIPAIETEHAAATGLDGQQAPHIWIVTGLPGDAAHRTRFLSYTQRLKQVLESRFCVQLDDTQILFGAEGHEGYKACTLDNLKEAMSRVVSLTKKGGQAWIFVIGHANPTADGANLNLPGPDISARSFGRLFQPVRDGAEIAFLFTTSTSGPFLKPLSTPGRVVIAATTGRGEVNETEFPGALVDVLERSQDDMSILDLFLAVKAQVKMRFDRQGLLQTEHAIIDTIGAGKGVEKPSKADAERAARFCLKKR